METFPRAKRRYIFLKCSNAIQPNMDAENEITQKYVPTKPKDSTKDPPTYMHKGTKQTMTV